jgi:hypothetical protein
MRLALFAVLALTATPAFAVTTPCLDMREVKGFDYRDGRTTIVRTRDGRSFEVKFAGLCGYTKIHPQLAFNQMNGFCLAKGNLLDSHDGGACVIRQISELEPAH